MRKSFALVVSVTLAVLLAGGAAWAAAGDLDPTFGDGGKVVGPAPGNPVPQYDCPVDDLSVVQPSGKVVAFAGCGVLARYNPDGSIDDTFGGGDGSVVPKHSDDDARDTRLEAFTVQPDGKLVVGGQVVTDPGEYPAHSDFTLMRFNEDGTLDTGFGGGDGKVSIGFGEGNSDRVTALAMQGANIVAAGQTSSGAVNQDAVLARFLPDGALDESFGGGDGKLMTDVSPEDEDFASAVDIDGEGRAVVGGGAAYNSSTDAYPPLGFGLARYLLE